MQVKKKEREINNTWDGKRTRKTDFWQKVWRFREKALYLCTNFGTQCKL